MIDNGKKHCPYCGSILTEKENEGRTRLYCRDEGRFIYDNPIPGPANGPFREGS